MPRRLRMLRVRMKFFIIRVFIFILVLRMKAATLRAILLDIMLLFRMVRRIVVIILQGCYFPILTIVSIVLIALVLVLSLFTRMRVPGSGVVRLMSSRIVAMARVLRPQSVTVCFIFLRMIRTINMIVFFVIPFFVMKALNLRRHHMLLLLVQKNLLLVGEIPIASPRWV